ncbi:histidine phosphatase family protein [Ligilactobacillus animalis]|uniref:histidine phosphatase family protein n=1 Tax=Ligilactobacillus animalis TaxID=1605 RepID=UPI00384C9408
MTTIYCVRHGQSEANLAQIMQGIKIDTPLTKLGQQQALAAKAKLANVSFDAVYASPLKRAVQTANLISSTTPTLDERLVEFDYGTWNGQLLTDLYAQYPMYFDEHHNLLPNSWEVSGGPTYAQVTAKLESFLAGVTKKHPDQTLLVVSHGFTLKLLAALLLDIGNLQNLSEPANASLTKLLVTPDTQTLVYYGK